MLRRFITVCVSGFALSAVAQAPTSPVVAGRLVVVYRDAAVPANAEQLAHAAGAKTRVLLHRLGVSLVQAAPDEEAAVAARLERQPEVAAVLHDRLVTGHAMPVRAVAAIPKPVRQISPPGAPIPVPKIASAPSSFGRMALRILTFPMASADATYDSPGGWAVQAAGGYGDAIPGGPLAGPWNTSRGAGIRIAVLDSGIDDHHPDLTPNVAVNLSEVDTTALPSACDDGSPADQQGHGTWAASLAAGAVGTGTGDVVGVAPQATLINIKVLERMPAATGATLTAQCEAGQTGGLLSWVLAGINDAVEQHADVVTMSFGTLIDLTTGDGAGWKASFDRVTYAAAQAGVVLVAAVGNDGLDLSGGRYIELPAQARDVLPVTASTNPACAESLATGATCAPGPVTRPYYSNYGATLNAIAAPGGSYPEGRDNAVSGWIRGACSSGLVNTADGLPADGKSFGCFGLGHVAYVQAMGTSASAPLVAGGAALLRAAHPDWTAEKILAVLRSTAIKQPAMVEPELNLPAALLAQ